MRRTSLAVVVAIAAIVAFSVLLVPTLGTLTTLHAAPFHLSTSAWLVPLV